MKDVKQLTIETTASIVQQKATKAKLTIAAVLRCRAGGV